MEIVRNPDGTLIVPVEPGRQHGDDADTAAADGGALESTSVPNTRVLHPGEGGYDEALAEWDRQQNPDADVAVSTASGREEAMSVVHAVAESPRHDVEPAVEALHDPEAVGEALRGRGRRAAPPARGHEDHRRGVGRARLSLRSVRSATRIRCRASSKSRRRFSRRRLTAVVHRVHGDFDHPSRPVGHRLRRHAQQFRTRPPLNQDGGSLAVSLAVSRSLGRRRLDTRGR